MLLKLILLLTLVPLVELLLLVRLTPLWGGFGVTVCVVILTGLLGAALARHEGLRVVRRLREQVQRGELPADALLDGVLIVVAAALLVTPGLLTDAVGFALLIPVTRGSARRRLKAWLRRRIEAGTGVSFASVEYRPISDEPPPGFPPLEDD